MPEDLFGCPSSTRSSADKPVFGASRSRPNFDQQIGLEGRSMPEDLFGCPSSTRSSADKPVFGASRSRPNFDQQMGLEGRSMPEDLFGCPSSTRSSADKPVFGASRSRPNFDQQMGLEGRSMPEDLFGCPSRRVRHAVCSCRTGIFAPSRAHERLWRAMTFPERRLEWPLDPPETHAENVQDVIPPTERNQDPVQTEMTQGMTLDGSRPLTEAERRAADHDTPVGERVYAPASERVPREPVPGHRDFVEHPDTHTPERQAVAGGEEEPSFTRVPRPSTLPDEDNVTTNVTTWNNA